MFFCLSCKRKCHPSMFHLVKYITSTKPLLNTYLITKSYVTFLLNLRSVKPTQNTRLMIILLLRHLLKKSPIILVSKKLLKKVTGEFKIINFFLLISISFILTLTISIIQETHKIVCLCKKI